MALIALVSIAQFVVAFLLPPWLRTLWRQQDLRTLAVAERGLMTAADAAEAVAETVVPALNSVFGGGGCALLARDGRTVRGTGFTPAELLLAARLRDDADGAEPLPGVIVLPLTHGTLVARGGSLLPVFGPDEADLLARTGTMVDLALERAELFTAEQRSRERAEHATAELQTLLYSVSHDLRSPLISVLGYLDVLSREHAANLGETGAHYLQRMSVNALYMQSLIRDLLELSRIGRTDDPVVDVDLRGMLSEIRDDVAVRRPAATARGRTCPAGAARQRAPGPPARDQPRRQRPQPLRPPRRDRQRHRHRAARRRAWTWSSPTTGAGSRPSTASASSPCSSASRPPAGRRTAEPAWAWPSAVVSWSCRAAPSASPTAATPRAPRSTSRCRPPPSPRGPP